jgi:hypothetical protein
MFDGHLLAVALGATRHRDREGTKTTLDALRLDAKQATAYVLDRVTFEDDHPVQRVGAAIYLASQSCTTGIAPIHGGS